MSLFLFISHWPHCVVAKSSDWSRTLAFINPCYLLAYELSHSFISSSLGTIQMLACFVFTKILWSRNYFLNLNRWDNWNSKRLSDLPEVIVSKLQRSHSNPRLQMQLHLASGRRGPVLWPSADATESGSQTEQLCEVRRERLRTETGNSVIRKHNNVKANEYLQI